LVVTTDNRREALVVDELYTRKKYKIKDMTRKLYTWDIARKLYYMCKNLVTTDNRRLCWKNSNMEEIGKDMTRKLYTCKNLVTTDNRREALTTGGCAWRNSYMEEIGRDMTRKLYLHGTDNRREALTHIQM
jgi:hypothetical protein